MLINNETRRIDPSLVPETYRRLEIVPVRGQWLTRKYCEDPNKGGFSPGECLCCLIGIVAAEVMSFGVAREVAMDTEEPTPTLGEAVGLSAAYSIGLDVGWENSTASLAPETLAAAREDPEYHVGVIHGKAAYQACVDAGLAIHH